MPRRQPSKPQTALQPRATLPPSSFPQILANYVPTCARSCLAVYIDQQYDCLDGDVSCLCSEYSASGFTLGELALVCLTLECPSATAEDSARARARAYDVCSTQNDAVLATQQTLVPPSTSSTKISSTITRTPPTPSTSSSSTTIQTTTTAPTTATSAPTENRSGQTSLTSEQAIGVSLAAAGFVLIAAGIFYILCCLRRRKRKATLRLTRQHSYDFVDNASAHGFQHTFSHYQKPVDDSKVLSEGAYSSEKRVTNWPSLPTQTQPYYRHEKKISQDRRTGRSDSPESYRSGSSIRTTSQLLPEKPSGLLLRPPARSPELGIMRTPATIFEEDRFSAHIAPPVPSLPKNPRQPQYAHQFAKAAEHRRQPSLTLDIPKQNVMAPPEKSLGPCPALRKTPQQSLLAHPQALMPGQSMPTYPPPPTFSQSVQTFAPPPVSATRPTYERSTNGNSCNSVLDYYASPEGESPTDLYSSTPIEDVTQVRRAAPAAISISKPSYPPMAVRASMTSDVSRRTSFESTDPDEPTPPEEEDKKLTPVKEAASPIADIRYPKIPRSSNQSIPRSPVYQSVNQFPTQAVSQAEYRHYETLHGRVPEGRDREGGHTACSSGSSLVAKRRGGDAANNLHITTNSSKGTLRTPPTKDSMAAYMREPPLRGYGRPANSARSTPDWPLKLEMRSPRGSGGGTMKSPLWEPKLTPRREGDDLYLSVSVATPQHSHFLRQ